MGKKKMRNLTLSWSHRRIFEEDKWKKVSDAKKMSSSNNAKKTPKNTKGITTKDNASKGTVLFYLLHA
jgi:hypothetical protein